MTKDFVCISQVCKDFLSLKSNSNNEVHENLLIFYFVFLFTCLNILICLLSLCRRKAGVDCRLW